MEMKGAQVVTEVTYREAQRVVVTVVPGSERPGFTVIENTGYQDDDMGQGEFSKSEVVEVHEDEVEAKRRVAELNETNGYTDHNSSGGEGYVGGSRCYRVGATTLHLCMVDGLHGQEGQKDQ